MNRSTHLARLVVACGMLISSSLGGHAQAATAVPAAPEAEPAAAPPPASPALAQLAWLRGCWAGNVNRRDFAEQWLPPRADMMVGVSHTIVESRKNPSQARTEDYTYLRLEARDDGVYYIAAPSGKTELPFKLTAVENDKGVTVFTFTGQGDGFPQRIVYRRTEGGMLFAGVAGKLDGKEKEVIYPMHPVDCATGESPRG
jgi:uncharacterized protein DUF6265